MCSSDLTGLRRTTGLTSVAFLDDFVGYGEAVTSDIVRRAYKSWERLDDFAEKDLELLQKYVEGKAECSPTKIAGFRAELEQSLASGIYLSL